MKNVVFKYEKDSKEVYAFLPDTLDFHKPGFNACYSRHGEHSACQKEYANACMDALYVDYENLLKFMIGIGYKQLNVLNMQVITYHRPPTKFEIKQGYGAIHYRDFLACDFINKSGNIKKWLKADDGLRYYR